MLRKLDFTTRIFLVSATLVVVALGAAAVATYLRGDSIAAAAADASLEHSREIQRNSETLRLQRLKLMSDLVANDTAFVSYVLETTSSNDPFGGSQSSSGSVKDLLTERQEQVGFDLGVVLDATGNPIAQVGGVNPIQGSLSADPTVAAVIKSQRVATGYWLRDNRVYQVAVAPLANRDQLAGYLVLALDIDQAELSQVARVSGSELAILDTSSGHDVPVAGTLPPVSLAALGPMLAGSNVRTDTPFRLTLGGERWLAQSDMIQPGVLALTLTSLDQAVSGYRAILTTLITAAVLATLVALALSGLLSRRVTEPLRQLAQAAQAAARGDYRHKLPVPTAGGEIAAVSQAVDSLLGDLREKDEMEKYMADLAKYQLDETADGVADATGDTPAKSTERVFLALGEASTVGAVPDANTFDALLQEIEAPVRRQGGWLAATTDRSAILVFAGLDAAYIAAGDVLHLAADRKRSISAALVSASVPVGRLEWTAGQHTAAIGLPVQRLEELLLAAPVGALVADAVLATKAKLLLDAKIQALPATGGIRDAALVELPTRADTITQTVVVGATPRPTSATGTREAAVRLEAGAVLGGRYEILSQVGAGGMGIVYKARDRQLDQIVALKTIRADGLNDPEMLANLKNEIRLSRQIAHRNVVRIYDLSEIAGLPFISMEYVRGMTLRYMLQKRERLPLSAGLRVVRQVCNALQVAHEQGILHRDVKPDNVMLEPTGNAKLMDFGIAGHVRTLDGASRESVIHGTPAYAPPEQLQGVPVDERADLYACGVLMYRTFTGRLPFDDRQLDKMISRKSKADYRNAQSLVPDLPSTLDAVISSCLKADRNARPRSAEALLKALETIRN